MKGTSCTTECEFRTTPSSSAAVLSNRYVSDRFLPDKAIDLVDEACAMIRTEIDSMPAGLDEVTRTGDAARNRRGGADERVGQGKRTAT